MVLVTGGTGFLGTYLLLHLIENDQNVRAIYRNENSILKSKELFAILKKPHLFEKIEWIKADILDIPALEIAFTGIEFVYHCAALISFDPKEEYLMRKVNIEGTANIVNFSLEHNVKKLCYVSTIAALGDLLHFENTITETTEWNPEKNHSDYAISKYGGEIEVWRGQEEGLNCVIINPGVILGIAGNWNEGSGKIFKTIDQGIRFFTTGSSGFVVVTDAVKIMFQLMKSDFKNEKYIVVAENIVFQKLVNSIADGLKVKRPTINIKKSMLAFLWRIDWIACHLFFQKRKLSKLMVRSLLTNDLYDNHKIKTALNFKFESIDQRIAVICAFYLKSKK